LPSIDSMSPTLRRPNLRRRRGWMQLGVTREPGGFDLGDLLDQHQPNFGIFVADIDRCRRLDPRRRSAALDETVRVAARGNGDP
jgi:hypothetical protein